MSDARNAIFSKIRQADHKRGGMDPHAARARLETPPPQLVPGIAQPDAALLPELFTAKAIELGCTVATCPAMNAVPAAVATYLDEQARPRSLALPAAHDVSGLNWNEAGIETTADIARETLDGATSLTRARAGVAETGAVAVASGDDYPVSLGLLPDRHIIVLKTNELVGGYEDVWRMARAAKDNQGMTRALIFVGGPSRTADIEATLVMGAHGPRAVHIILVG